MRLFDRLLPFCHRFAQDKSGISAVVFAISLPVFVGFIGLGAEVGLWYLTERKAQSAADMAAYTGALELRDGSSTSAIYSGAKDAAIENGFRTSTSTLTLTVHGKDRVRVVVKDHQPRFFSSLFIKSSAQTIAVEAEASFVQGGPACVLALNTTATDAISFAGGANVDLTSCNIMSNSAAAQALQQTGSSNVSADCVYSVGGMSYTGSLKTTNCAKPVPYATASRDPYRNLNVPTLPTTCDPIPATHPKKATTISPGRFCGTLSIKGDVTMSPGTYIIDGGNFEVNSYAKLAGSGVTIILTGGGYVQMNGTATINLEAPTTGKYSGILFFQDRLDSGYTHVINGDSTSTFEGALYFPASNATLNGSAASVGGCLQLIADTIKFAGDNLFEHDCSTSGTKQIDVSGAVALTL